MNITDLVAIQKLPEKQKARARRGKIVFIYEDRKPGWSGILPFYLFACENTDCVNHTRLAIDYAHGFKNHNERVICPDCRAKKYFPVTQPTFRQIIEMFFKYRRRLKNFQKQKELADGQK